MTLAVKVALNPYTTNQPMCTSLGRQNAALWASGLKLVVVPWIICRDCQEPAGRVIFVASRTLSAKGSTPDIQVPDHALPVERVYTLLRRTVRTSPQQDQPAWCRLTKNKFRLVQLETNCRRHFTVHFNRKLSAI